MAYLLLSSLPARASLGEITSNFVRALRPWIWNGGFPAAERVDGWKAVLPVHGQDAELDAALCATLVGFFVPALIREAHADSR